jgi:hydrophobic/amphiphilic exporter-1 (mainly G- bacteria), HAE1 family
MQPDPPRPVRFQWCPVWLCIAVIPITVICTLAVSVVEALVVLPSHLAHHLKIHENKKLGPWGKFHKKIDQGIQWIVSCYQILLRIATEYRYATLGAGLFILLIAVGIGQSGYVKFLLFPKLDSDFVNVQLVYPEGTGWELTSKTTDYIEAKFRELRQELKEKYSFSEDFVLSVYKVIGQIGSTGGGLRGSNISEINVELLPSETRKLSSDYILSLWREKVGEIPGIESLSFGGREGGPGGKAIQVQFRSHSFEDLQNVAQDLKTHLRIYPGIFNIQDDFQAGTQEVRIELKEHARHLGINLADIARQVRNAFYGNEILRIQRSKFDVRVFLRYPLHERIYLSDLERIKIRTS